ncbi:restriction endonuclease [Methylococcaceae bacterium HT1]|nr:restriction endonuclease [Methylococcaceae bacterium HT1]TXL12994.1 restriction endonuclease [Methylococcaceae bacterium HT3]
MKKGFLSEYFQGVSVKRLSSVEVNAEASNQHEFNGARGLLNLLGRDKLSDCPARFLWLGEENEGISEDSFVTWYDSREKHLTRTEYRLYFRSNPVMELAQVNDLLIVAKRPNNEFMIIVVSEGSTIENQLLWLFNLHGNIEAKFQYHQIEEENIQVDFAVRFILEELGIEVEEPESERLDNLLEKFNGAFPKTVIFSDFARNTISGIVPQDDPDQALLSWIEWEEKLFRRMERHIVSERLNNGFIEPEGADVEGFIKFSLSVQNRRKSRIGHALEHHVEAVFKACNVQYDRQAVTENKTKPDFLFPSMKDYHNTSFPVHELSMLGVKSTCKDRWRQVLSEAAKIENKHLLTLQPGISENQTNEMKSNNLQLVIPKGLHQTYQDNQQNWLMSFSDFIMMVKGKARVLSQ